MIVTDFIKENIFSEIEDELRDLNIGVLGWTFFILPFRLKHLFTHQMQDKGNYRKQQCLLIPPLCNWIFLSTPVNNVGLLPSFIPCKFLDCAELDQVSGTAGLGALWSFFVNKQKLCLRSLLLTKIHCVISFIADKCFKFI